MIKSISFKNYKIFKEMQSLRLKPITVLFGKNNSGKSAVAKLPTLVEGSLRRSSLAEFSVTNDNVELGSELRDLVYGKANRAIEFEIESVETNSGGEQEHKLNIRVVIESTGYTQLARIERWNYDDRLDLEYENKNNLYRDTLTEKELLAGFEGFYLTHLVKADKPDSSEDIVSHLFKLKTDFIGPIRTKPSRDYRMSSVKSNKTGIHGENAYSMLINSALSTERKLLNDVSNWYSENFEGWQLNVNTDKSPIYQVEIQREGLKLNLLDTGIGISQVLPVIVRAKQQCDEETLIIIEEPEIHLHPAAHGNLAQLFVESLTDKNKRYLIETHSLNFILRLRRLVAQKAIDSRDIALYYVDFSEEQNASSLKEINIDDLGRVDYWPEGIFNETLNETIGIRTAQLEKKANENRD
jgi:predicted ATPase